MNNVILNYNDIKDKIHACWIGKNIGGTIGGPFEHHREYLDVKGFTTQFGAPLPNDDLDLQLMWLYALEKEGPYHFNASTLAEYWTLGIDPNWNEYGTAKANLFDGIMPPLCGELNNDSWKESNGAWIRSEVWACLAPCYPDIARLFAYYDAVVDHGINEGTYAELFTVTLQSLAFKENNISVLIDQALMAIPKDCKVAKAINIVKEEYKKGTPYREVRELLVNTFGEDGWFQSPLNLGFVAIGLLYGEGDFKKSLLYAVNCGDDADCTAGTVGATLGIAFGTKILPPDWTKHIGDDIVTCCINAHYRKKIPQTCKELTDRVIEMMPILFKSRNLNLTFGEQYDLPECKFKFNYQNVMSKSKYSFEIPSTPHTVAVGEYDRLPVVKEGEQLTIKLSLTNVGVRANNFKVTVYTPDGWQADYQKSFHLATFGKLYKNEWSCNLSIGKTQSLQHVIVICEPSIHAIPVIADFVIKG